MITNLLFDFSWVILFPKEETYTGKLNDLYKKVLNKESSFLDNFRFNTELLEYIKSLKDRFTVSIYTTDIIQNDPVAKDMLNPIFQNIFAANDLGISKKDPHGYLVIAEKLKAEPPNILFIDDTKANIEAANHAGLQVIQYLSNKQLFQDLKSKLQSN